MFLILLQCDMIDECCATSAGRVDWVWLHSLLHAQKHGPVMRVQLQMGPPNGLLPARYERHDRLLAQLTGRRRILLLPPSQVGSTHQLAVLGAEA